MSKKVSQIRVLLADDHVVLRDGLQALLAAQGDMEVAGAVGTGRSTVRLAKALRPDVIIMDIGMPDLNGIDAARRILKEMPDAKILCLSMHREQSMIEAMFRAGASGYLVKECAGHELLDAVRILASGKTYISPVIAGDVVQHCFSDNIRTSEGIYAELSPREREVLQLIAEGRNTKEIAAELDISDKTVAAHRLSLMDKLGCYSVADLTRYAIRQNLVKL